MLGRFEEAILLALLSAKGELTTAEIYNALAEKLKRVSPGAVYTTLGRMQTKKFVTRRRGDVVHERGGKARYYYRITGSGRAALIEAQEISTAFGWPLSAKLASAR
jgi:PadR family transcriptional regulator, regulatory protein PadR